MGKSILVVDDSETVRQQLRTALEPHGFEIIEADNGATGLAAADSRQMDLIIVDVNMPVMDGIELVTHLRQRDAYKKTPIFVLTTDAGGSAVERGKIAGATAWIVKPFKQDVLLRGIQKVLAS